MLITPPPALPQSADAFDRTTSTRSVAARSTRSKHVRPSGSVSGMPSRSRRTPRDVPGVGAIPRSARPESTDREPHVAAPVTRLCYDAGHLLDCFIERVAAPVLE